MSTSQSEKKQLYATVEIEQNGIHAIELTDSQPPARVESLAVIRITQLKLERGGILVLGRTEGGVPIAFFTLHYRLISSNRGGFDFIKQLIMNKCTHCNQPS